MAGERRQERDATSRAGLLKSPENMAAGAFLLALASIGFFGSLENDVGTLAAFGAGMVPRAISVLIALCGAGLIALSFASEGPKLERWSLRGLVFVLGAVVTFGLTIRGFDIGPLRIPALGLIVAGPLSIALASRADPETRSLEVIVLAVALTALCIGLFRFMLRLPIPVAPWLVGY